MPKVDTYDSQVTQQDALNTPLQRLNSNGAFGEDVGKSVMGLASDLNKLAAENDNAVAKERVNAYRDRLREAMYNADDAYYRTNGRDAMMGRDDARQRVSDIRKEVGEGLSGRQLKYFDTLAQQYQDREFDGIEGHSFKGRNDWLDTADKTTIETAAQDLIVNPTDPQPYIKQIENSYLNIANRNGWDKDKRELETSKAVTAAHKTAIERIMESDPTAAQAYYDAAKEKGQILPSMYEPIESALSAHADAAAAQTIAAEIRASGGDRASRMAAVNAIANPEQKKLAQAQVVFDIQQEKLAKEEGELAAYDEALKAVNSGMSASQWRLANPQRWAAMSGVQQRALLKGNATETDMRAYWVMKGKLAQGQNEAREYLLANLDQFSSAHTKQFMDQLFKPAPELSNVLGDKPAFDQLVDELYGKEPSKGEARNNWNLKYNITMGMYQDRLTEWHEANPDKKIIPERDRREILNRFKVDMYKQESLGGFDYLWPDSQVTLDDIPATEMKQIEARLIEQGLPVTTKNILIAFTKG